MATKRSGFTNVRVCCDCKQPIGEGDRCGCPADHPFARGLEVTLCHDEAREKPRAFGVVARLGNGAFRLEGSGSWYDFNGSPVHEPQGALVKGEYVRPRRPEDQALLDRRSDLRAMLNNVERWEREIKTVTDLARKQETEHGLLLKRAAQLDREAAAAELHVEEEVKKAAGEARRRAEMVVSDKRKEAEGSRPWRRSTRGTPRRTRSWPPRIRRRSTRCRTT